MPHIAPPYEYRCSFCATNGGCDLQCADDLDRVILMEGADTVAAFFAEPIVGTSATGLTPHPDYCARVHKICGRHDVLFVADEVLCGYGRTGAPFAISAWNVEPEIITLGKAIGSGYAPLAAMLVSERIRDAFTEGSGRFVHGLTYSITPSSCFVGLKVHEIMTREGLFTRAGAIGRVSNAQGTRSVRKTCNGRLPLRFGFRNACSSAAIRRPFVYQGENNRKQDFR